MAVEPMTVRIIQEPVETVSQVMTEAPQPLMTSESGTRRVDSVDVEPVEFKERETFEPPPPKPIEPPPEEPLPEPEAPPIEKPLELPPPAQEEPPPPEPIELPKPVQTPPKEVPVQTGPVEQESQSGVASRAVPSGKGNRAPLYPRRARAAKMEGTTELEVLVRPDGTVARLTVHKSSGHSLLDDEAMKAVKRWRFTPAKSPSGSAAEDRVIVPVTFRLRKK